MTRDREPVQPNIADQTSDNPEGDSSPSILRFKVLDGKDHTIRELTNLWQQEKKKANKLQFEMAAKDAEIEGLKEQLTTMPVRIMATASILAAKVAQEEALRKEKKVQIVADRRAVIREQEKQASFSYKFQIGAERFFSRLGLVAVRAMEIMAETPQIDPASAVYLTQIPRNTKS